MSVERHLPENRARQVQAQLTDTQGQMNRLANALDALNGVLFAFIGAGDRIDPTTRHTYCLLEKCLSADLAAAQRSNEAAYRVWCEFHGVDPNEEQTADPIPTKEKR